MHILVPSLYHFEEAPVLSRRQIRREAEALLLDLFEDLLEEEHRAERGPLQIALHRRAHHREQPIQDRGHIVDMIRLLKEAGLLGVVELGGDLGNGGVALAPQEAQQVGQLLVVLLGASIGHHLGCAADEAWPNVKPWPMLGGRRTRAHMHAGC